MTLDCHVPLDVELDALAVHEADAEALMGFMRKMEFSTLLRRVAQGLGAELPEGTPPPKDTRKKKSDYDHPLRRVARGEAATPQPDRIEGGSPAELAVQRAAKIASIPFDRSAYETVTDPQRLADLLEAARYQGHMAFRAKLNATDPDAGRAGRRGDGDRAGARGLCSARAPGERRASISADRRSHR